METRRVWYLGFGVVLLLLAAILVILNAHIGWFVAFMLLLVAIAIHDVTQKSHTLLRTFPVLGHIRYILEFFRPEIRQYFIADDKSERPYDRETRTVIYQRSKNVDDTQAFGTDRDMTQTGYEWVSHSLAPKRGDEVAQRILVGGPDCRQPYDASRLNISAMSFGSLSPNALMALNKGAKEGGFYHNTGEGGLSSYHMQGGDICLQIGTGYFGVRDKQKGTFSEDEFVAKAQKREIKMIEIKLSQGAKPAHGGMLPAGKITPEIAEIRGVPMGADVISPPSHSAFDGPSGLCHFVARLRELSGGKPIGFKLAIGARSQFLSICKAMVATGIQPDFITIDGAEGGTGAAPMEYANHLGMPLDDALSFAHQALTGFGLRKDIRLIASGRVATGFDMVRKLAIGADMCNAARAMMMSVGCIQSRQCNKNTCPVGVATTNPRLYKMLDVEDKAQRVRNYHHNTIRSFRSIVGAMGMDNPSQLHGYQIYRRVGPGLVKSYEEIYPPIPAGCLLDEDSVPSDWLRIWRRANPDQFGDINFAA